MSDAVSKTVRTGIMSVVSRPSRCCDVSDCILFRIVV